MTKTEERKKMILAMEYIARQINDEDVFDGWLMCGVPDGDVQYGCFDITTIDDEDYFLEDDNFSNLMTCFLRRMYYAYDSGGLYCSDVVSGTKGEAKDKSVEVW